MCCMFPVDQCKKDEVSNYELRQRRGREAPANGLERTTIFQLVFPLLKMRTSQSSIQYALIPNYLELLDCEGTCEVWLPHGTRALGNFTIHNPAYSMR
jgi:hypothetical protein